MNKKNNHLFLVDGSSYIFRAYHALPPLTRKSDGLPIGAVSGFCNMLWKLLCEARDTALGIVPTHFAVIFDYSSQTFRKEIYPAYKANRPSPPEDLVPQFSLIRQATRAFNVPCIEKEGFEADDLIATYAKMASRAGFKTTIIASDKDLMQLINDDVLMYDSMKDKQIGIAEVEEKMGVRPEKMIDLQSLTGDSTDNIPGIPGIGPKTAAQLLAEYGHLDALLAQADQIKQPKRRQNIIACADQTKIAKQLVTLKDDVAVDIDLDGLILEPQDGPKLIGFLKAMDLTRLTRRVAAVTATDANQIEALLVDVEHNKEAHGPDIDLARENQTQGDKSLKAGNSPLVLAEKRKNAALQQKIDTSHYETIVDKKVLAAWLSQATDQGFFAFDTETTSLDPIQAELVGFSLALAPGKAAYVPLNHKDGHDDLLSGGRNAQQIDVFDALTLLKPVLENPAVLKIAQNMKYDWLVMRNVKTVSADGITIKAFDDTMLISYVLDAGALTHGMDALSTRWLGHKPISYQDITGKGRQSITFDCVALDAATAYSAEDADITLRLWHVMKPMLVAKKLVHVYESLERPLVEVLAQMEQRGVLIDRQLLSRLSGELAQSAAVLEEQIYQHGGEKFNIASPKQLGDILFGKMGLPGGEKTKTGQWSTSAQVLEDLAANGHALPRKIVDWRQLIKLKSTYTDALPHYIDKGGRVHTNYSMAATTTGRLASSEPNLQNIPVRTLEGRKIRQAFIAQKGHFLLSADYSQIELRVLAHVANIDALKQAFSQGVDIHAMTAAEMFNVAMSDMTPEIRRRAKAINFGIIYGISAYGLAKQLGIARDQASQYMKTYFERFPGIRAYMDKTKAFARAHGFVETIFGRRVHYPAIKAANAQVRALNERAAINAPIQGSASDIIRRAMIMMEGALQKSGLAARMLLQVHDELIFELPENEAAQTIALVKQVMENATMPALSLSVPLQVDARVAKNWDEAH